MLVGGVDEEDWPFEVVASTVMVLMIDSGEDGRVASAGLGGAGAEDILLRITENILL